MQYGFGGAKEAYTKSLQMLEDLVLQYVADVVSSWRLLECFRIWPIASANGLLFDLLN